MKRITWFLLELVVLLVMVRSFSLNYLHLNPTAEELVLVEQYIKVGECEDIRVVTCTYHYRDSIIIAFSQTCWVNQMKVYPIASLKVTKKKHHI